MLLQARYSSSIGTKVLEHEDEGPPSGSESDCLEDKYCDLVEKRQEEMQKDGGMTMDEMMKAIAGSADPQDPAHKGQPDGPKGTSKPGKGHAPRDTPTKAKKRPRWRVARLRVAPRASCSERERKREIN